jgi:hypothetical protein
VTVGHVADPVAAPVFHFSTYPGLPIKHLP